MYFENRECKKMPSVFGFLTGIIIFVAIYGIRVLNPFYVDWLLGKTDLTQHYLGWEFYRQDIWRFPIGMTNRLNYPLETSIVFTDSIPIFAVTFKILNHFLPQYFQYMGFWGLLCFGLQGYFTVKIFNRFNVDCFCTLIGCVFMVTAPIVLFRMFWNTSLAAQWIILAAIYLFFTEEDYIQIYKKIVIYWAILGFLVAGIHLYFLPMCFLFVAGYSIKMIILDKRPRLIHVLPIFSYLATVIGNTWILGGFSSHARASYFGLESEGCNLNTLFNGQLGFSRILPGPTLQYQGFAYLGGGILCAIIVNLLLSIINKFVKKDHLLNAKISIDSVIIIVICIICFIIASPVVCLGDKVLFAWHLPSKAIELWSIFRSTGRFVWPVWYLVTIYTIKGITNLNYSKHRVTIIRCILGICLAIQLFDISSAIIERHDEYSKKVSYDYPDSEFWDKLSVYRNFRCVYFGYRGAHIVHNLRIAEIALKYGWVMNSFYFARDIEPMGADAQSFENDPPLQSDCIYVFFSDQTELLKRWENTLRYYNTGDLVIGITWLDDDGNVNDFSYN